MPPSNLLLYCEVNMFSFFGTIIKKDCMQASEVLTKKKVEDPLFENRVRTIRKTAVLVNEHQQNVSVSF